MGNKDILKQNTHDIAKALQEAVDNKTLTIVVGDDYISLKLGTAEDITLLNESGGGTWHVNDWTG